MSDAATHEPAAVGSAAWWFDHGRRSERRRPRRDGLSLERIVQAAVDLVDADGLDALTVRRLADDLATGSASLYRHVASRDEVLVLAVDHVLGEVRLADDELVGRARVEWIASELRRVLMGHPNLVPALTASPLLGPNAVRGAWSGLAYFIEAGFPPEAAVPAHLALIDYVLGTVFFDTSRAGRSVAEEPDGFAGPTEGMDPSIAALAGIARPSTDEVFAFGLRTFLDGLATRFPGTR